jgi:hypothetical protein
MKTKAAGTVRKPVPRNRFTGKPVRRRYGGYDSTVGMLLELAEAYSAIYSNDGYEGMPRRMLNAMLKEVELLADGLRRHGARVAWLTVHELRYCQLEGIPVDEFLAEKSLRA